MRSRSLPDPEPAELSPLTLLVIDPDERVRTLLRRMFEPHICRLVEAADGAAGLQLVESHPIPLDAVLVELRMQGIGGAEAVAALAECCPRLPLIAMSADAVGKADLPEGVAFVAKPFEPREVIATVIEALVKGRAARPGGRGRLATAGPRANGATIQREKLNLIAAVLALRERRPARQL